MCRCAQGEEFAVRQALQLAGQKERWSYLPTYSTDYDDHATPLTSSSVHG
jgi:hypothetical protein